MYKVKVIINLTKYKWKVICFFFKCQNNPSFPNDLVRGNLPGLQFLTFQSPVFKFRCNIVNRSEFILFYAETSSKSFKPVNWYSGIGAKFLSNFLKEILCNFPVSVGLLVFVPAHPPLTV